MVGCYAQINVTLLWISQGTWSRSTYNWTFLGTLASTEKNHQEKEDFLSHKLSNAVWSAPTSGRLLSKYGCLAGPWITHMSLGRGEISVFLLYRQHWFQKLILCQEPCPRQATMATKIVSAVRLSFKTIITKYIWTVFWDWIVLFTTHFMLYVEQPPTIWEKRVRIRTIPKTMIAANFRSTL